MKKMLLLTLAVTSLLSGIDANDVLDRTIEKYRNMNSFYAEFEQVYCDEESGMCQRFEGKTYYLRPNFFRMEIAEPNQIYVGDSVSLWIYMPDENRVVRQKLDRVPFQINPDALFANYKEEYDPAIKEETDGAYEIALEPKEETGVYQRMTVTIKKGSFEISGITITDEAGAESKFEFTKMEINKKISRKVFEFKPPKGAKVDEY